MQAAKKIFAIKQAFLKLMDSTNTEHLSDTDNMTALVADFADCDGYREARIIALADEIEQNKYLDQDIESGSVIFGHKGVKILINNISENYDNEGYYFGIWMSHGDITCTASVLGIPGGGYRTRFHSEEDNWKEIATEILDLMEDGRYCSLCCELNLFRGQDICRTCALSTLRAPCTTCHKQIGFLASPDADENEHRACKRRRLGE